jgi:putative DNA primase/helicase
MFETLRLFLAQHGASRFEDLDRKEDATTPQDRNDANRDWGGGGGGDGNKPQFEPRIINRAGFVRAAGKGQEFLIFPVVWANDIFNGMDAKRAARVFLKAGFLLPDDDVHLQQKVRIPGQGRPRFYVVKGTILEGEWP